MYTCIFAWRFSDIKKKRSLSSRAYSLNTIVVKNTCLLMKLNLLWNYFFPMQMTSFSKQCSRISVFFPTWSGILFSWFTTFILIIAKDLQIFQPNYMFGYLLIEMPTLLARGWRIPFQESLCIKNMYMDYILLEYLKLSEIQKYCVLLFWKCEHSFLNT